MKTTLYPLSDIYVTVGAVIKQYTKLFMLTIGQ